MAIFKKRGKWWIGYKTGEGKLRREPVGTSFKLAKQVLAKRQAQIAEQRHFRGRVANAKTFADALRKFWELHGQYLRSKSWESMLREVEKNLGDKKIGKITAADIQRYYNRVRQRASSSTANRHMNLLHSIFNKAKAWGDFYGENPCTGVKREREPAHRLRYLTSEEMDRLLGCVQPRLLPVVVCALMTGMRRSEILGMEWQNVDRKRGMIYVLKTKSAKPREIPIAGKLARVLTDLGPKDAGRVFDIPVITVRRHFLKALKAAGIQSFRFHDLRHTFASWFMMKGGNIYTLQKLLGHSSVVMTMRYAHLSQGHLASEMAVFESAIPVPPSVPHVDSRVAEYVSPLQNSSAGKPRDC